MKTSLCHYSLHRTWKEKNWNTEDLVKRAGELGFDAVDFHAGLLADPNTAVERVEKAMSGSGMALSGFSLSTNFNIDDPRKFQEEIDKTNAWIRVAAQLHAPVSRIFGGHIPADQRADPDIRAEKMKRISEGIREVLKTAEREGIILALENHGGLPCTGEEQADVIRTINSPHLRATVDVGNYLQGGQSGAAGTRAAAEFCAYVHFKDFKKIADANNPLGYTLQACIVGDGDVEHAKCLEYLASAGYNGYVALEFEGVEGEDIGVPKSKEFMDSVMRKYSANP